MQLFASPIIRDLLQTPVREVRKPPAKPTRLLSQFGPFVPATVNGGPLFQQDLKIQPVNPNIMLSKSSGTPGGGSTPQGGPAGKTTAPDLATTEQNLTAFLRAKRGGRLKNAGIAITGLGITTYAGLTVTGALACFLVTSSLAIPVLGVTVLAISTLAYIIVKGVATRSLKAAFTNLGKQVRQSDLNNLAAVLHSRTEVEINRTLDLFTADQRAKLVPLLYAIREAEALVAYYPTNPADVTPEDIDKPLAKISDLPLPKLKRALTDIKSELQNSPPKIPIDPELQLTAEDGKTYIVEPSPENEPPSKYSKVIPGGLLIGQGGTADVYLAKDATTGDKVALKIMAKDRITQESTTTQKRRLAQEFEILTTKAEIAESPVFMKALSCGTKGLQFFFTMRYMDPGTMPTLEAFLSAPHDYGVDLRGEPGNGILIDILTQICKGLAIAARLQIFHRDIKPTNIFISIEQLRDGTKVIRPIISDFGMAKDFSYGSELTRTGLLMGTEPYMAPYYIKYISSKKTMTEAGQETMQAKIDMYALGIIICKMFNGIASHPFADFLAGNFETFSQSAQQGTITSPYLANIPDTLKSITAKLLSTKHEGAYANYEDLIAELKGVPQRHNGPASLSQAPAQSSSIELDSAALAELTVSEIDWATAPAAEVTRFVAEELDALIDSGGRDKAGWIRSLNDAILTLTMRTDNTAFAKIIKDLEGLRDILLREICQGLS